MHDAICFASTLCFCQQIPHDFRRDVLQLWPLVSLINYKYVPLKLRVLVMQAIAFFW